MASRNLTLTIKGDITFRDLVNTFSVFQKLLDVISQEITPGSDIEWIPERLQTGSAVVTMNGMSENMESVERTVGATDSIFTCLSHNSPIPYSETIARSAREFTQVIKGRIQEISVNAGESERRVTARVEIENTKFRTYTHDAIKGTINTLKRHRAFQFTLYDSLFGKPVFWCPGLWAGTPIQYCHLSPEQEDEMRKFWGKTVLVSGLVGRNSNTGRPISIRNVREISEVQEVAPGSYDKARGILDLGDRRPEDLIRELRESQWDLPHGQQMITLPIWRDRL